MSFIFALLCLLFAAASIVFCYPQKQIPLSQTELLAPIFKVPQDVFQVHPPVLTSAGPEASNLSSDGSTDQDKTGNDLLDHGPACKSLLMEHSFGFSYGHPFVGGSLSTSLLIGRK